MPVDERFTIRSYEHGDETAILQMFARAFPHAPRRLDHWQWKFQANPFGRDRISLAFDGDGSLAGHYAGYSVPFRERGVDLLSHQIGDTMTEPSIRHLGRGPTSVLGRTALHFYATFCEGQVAFNYGFNVANIQKFSLRFLRSDRVEPVPYRVRDLRQHPLRPLGRLERKLHGWHLERVTTITPEFDELFRRVERDYEFLVRRDGEYVRWRYLDCPDVDYVVIAIRKWRTLAGWLVYRVRDNRFVLGDALFDRRWPDALEIALRHLVERVDVIEGWFPGRPAWFDRILLDLGFKTRPEPQDLSLMCVPFGRPDAPARMRESLYYTMGDSDLF